MSAGLWKSNYVDNSDMWILSENLS